MVLTFLCGKMVLAVAEASPVKNQTTIKMLFIKYLCE